MEKRESTSAISRTASAPKPQGVSKSPTAPAVPGPAAGPDLRRPHGFKGLSPDVVLLLVGRPHGSKGLPPVVLLLAVLFAAVAFCGFGQYVLSVLSHPPPPFNGARVITPLSPGWSQAPVTAGARVCADFIRLKNDGDPAALDLLGSPPGVPDHPISPEEADRIQTDFFLRQDLHVVGVGPERKNETLVLYTKGNVSAPTLRVRNGAEVETAQRTMANPDLTVEVRDGKIYGVAASLHQ